MVMVGKQAWKLMTSLDSLITKLLTVKYYPNGDYFGASITHNLSYAWKGLKSVRDVVNRGMKWSIGTGKTIPMWNQPWLRDKVGLTPLIYLHIMWDDLKVKHLFKPTTKQLNHE